MSDHIEFEHAGLTVEVHQEEEPSFADPRDNDNLGVMFCDHRSYDLGDKDAPDPRVAVENGEESFEVQIVRYLTEAHGARVILPLFLYDHSGITMFTGGRLDKAQDDMSTTNRYPFDAQGWDTSSIGVIFDTAECRKVCGCDDLSDEKIEKQLRAEVEEYDAYLRGDVFYYTIRDEDGDILAGCGGFIDPNIMSDDSYTRQEARAEAEACAQQVQAEQAEAHEWACRDTVTV